MSAPAAVPVPEAVGPAAEMQSAVETAAAAAAAEVAEAAKTAKTAEAAKAQARKSLSEPSTQRSLSFKEHSAFPRHYIVHSITDYILIFPGGYQAL